MNIADEQKTNLIAILSLIFAFLMPLVGLILGLIAMNQIKQTNEGGRGLALAGVIISSVFLLMSVLFLILWIVGIGWLVSSIPMSG